MEDELRAYLSAHKEDTIERENKLDDIEDRLAQMTKAIDELIKRVALLRLLRTVERLTESLRKTLES